MKTNPEFLVGRQYMYIIMTLLFVCSSCMDNGEENMEKQVFQKGIGQRIDSLVYVYRLSEESYVRVLDHENRIVTITRPFPQNRVWNQLLGRSLLESLELHRQIEKHLSELEDALIGVPEVDSVKWVVIPDTTYVSRYRASPSAAYKRFIVAFLLEDTLSVTDAFSRSAKKTGIMYELLQLIDEWRKERKTLLIERSSDGVSVTNEGEIRFQFVREKEGYKIDSYEIVRE